MENTEIKEFIYLDNTEINSLLAQFEDGIPQVIQSIKQTGLSNTKKKSEKYGHNAEVGLNAGLRLKGAANGLTSTGSEETTDQMSQEAISTIYSDYAVNIVTKELKENHLLKPKTKLKEGNFIQVESGFNLIDPISMGSNVDPDAFMKVINYDADSEEESSSEETINGLKDLSEITHELFPDSVLIKTKNAISIAKSKSFRMNNAQLRMLSFANRSITILGKIESIISEEDFRFPDEESDISLDLTQTLSKFSLTVLSNIADAKPNDIFIKPLAIYFK